MRRLGTTSWPLLYTGAVKDLLLGVDGGGCVGLLMTDDENHRNARILTVLNFHRKTVDRGWSVKPAVGFLGPVLRRAFL